MVIFLLAACMPAQVTTPDPAEIENQVATSVALTVASQNLETAQAAPQETATPLPTDTPAVVDSPTPIVPTATPFVVVPPTTVPGGGGAVSNPKPEYACDVIHQRPYDNTIFKPGDKFDIKWTILNTGTKIMQDGLDLKYNSGTQMTAVTRVELPQLDPREQYDLQFDAVAPSKQGTYVMTFIVEGGLCYPYIVIKVEK
jgi:hypothetical protein